MRIVFDRGLAIFARADGVVLGEVNLRALPPAGGGRVAPVHVGAVAPAQLSVVADARKALMALGLGVREADSSIAAAGPCSTTDQLVLAALRCKPLPV